MDNYAAWKTPQYLPAEFGKLGPLERCLHLCALAHLAPSTHNTQPWKFWISPNYDVIQLYLNRQTVLPASDVSGRQAVVSCGAALAHLKLAAEYYGYTTEVTLAPINTELTKPLPEKNDSSALTLLAAIKINPGEPNLSLKKIVASIWNRKMMRAEFNPTKAIPKNIIDNLESWTDGNITKLHLISDPLRRLSIAEFQAQADGYVINSPRFSKELGDWLLPNDTKSFVGMPGIGFGLKDEEAKRLHEGLSGLSPLEAEDGLRFALGGKLGLEKSPLIGFITTKNDDPASWLAAGEAFEGINLSLVAEGIDVAMHAGITEVPLVKKIFGMTLGTIRPITVLFRAGYLLNPSDSARPHSPRQPITDVIFTKKPGP